MPIPSAKDRATATQELRAHGTTSPHFIEPAYPTQRERPPDGDQWIHEIKVDDYRPQLHVREGAAWVYSRRGYDWTDRFKSIAHDAPRLPLRQAVIDGEVIVATAAGLSDFNALQIELARHLWPAHVLRLSTSSTRRASQALRD